MKFTVRAETSAGTARASRCLACTLVAGADAADVHISHVLSAGTVALVEQIQEHG